MSGEKRRENLLKILQESHKPVSGTKLAEKFQVSRQVVVQDIALLRASNHDIVSTHKGYVLKDKDHISRVFKVKHSEEKMLDELNLIVDCGGKVEDVFVYHKLYNVVRVPMNIKSRMDAKKYVESIKGGSFGSPRADNIWISLSHSSGRFRGNFRHNSTAIAGTWIFGCIKGLWTCRLLGRRRITINSS